MNEPTSAAGEQPPVRELNRAQRRVLGVLIEKGFTTPEVYPLTLKATTTGCNQKSNRDPVVNYEEEKVERVLDELRELGLVAIVHTESGRSARFRHYMRHKFTLSEAQLAILTELLLRGRQSVGELRVRASRMSAIDTLEQLKQELQGLIDLQLVESDGSLDRRGAEVDHTLYPAGENRPTPTRISSEDDSSSESAGGSALRSSGSGSSGSGELQHRLQELEARVDELVQENRQLREQMSEVQSALEQLRSALGG
ncbi:MAG: DUF480 domain-containing protein [Planctomycetales bacterium]